MASRSNTDISTLERYVNFVAGTGDVLRDLNPGYSGDDWVTVGSNYLCRYSDLRAAHEGVKMLERELRLRQQSLVRTNLSTLSAIKSRIGYLARGFEKIKDNDDPIDIVMGASRDGSSVSYLRTSHLMGIYFLHQMLDEELARRRAK